MLKKILIGIAVVVVLVIAGLVAVATFVDVDHYKPQIEALVHDKLDRTLAFEGKLGLSVFPTIAVTLPRTTLSEHGSDQPFVSLDRARVSLAVLPLLAGRVEAGTVSLYGLRVAIERHADGSTSIDDLTGRAKAKAAAQSRPAGTGGAMPAFAVGGIELEDAQVIVRDERSKDTVTLSRVNLHTGALGSRATTPIELSASVTATHPQAAFEITAKGTVELDLAAKAYGVQGLDAHVSGHLGEDTIDVALTAPALRIDPEHASGELLKLAAKVTGAHTAHADVALEKISGTGEKVDAARFTLDAGATLGARTISAHLASPLQAGIAAQTFELAKIDGDLGIDAPDLPQKSIKAKLDGSLRVDAKAESVASQLGARFDDTTASARVGVQGFSEPHIRFDVSLDQLNLDRYLPPPAPAKAAAEPAAASPASAPADPAVDLSALKPLNLAGELRIGALQVHNAKVSKLKVGVQAAGGHLDLAPLDADLYEGSLAASAKVDAAGNRMGVVAALKGISLGPLLKDQVGKETLDGHGEVKLNITTDGPTVGALRKALDGTASLALRDGAVHGINVAQKLRELKSTFSGGGVAPAQAADASEKTDFSEMTASFVIHKGVATNNDLLAKSPLLRLGGAGIIDIGAGTLDYTVKATVVATLAGQGGNDLAQLNGVTLPVHLTGPFAAMSYQLDWSSVAAQAIKSKAADKVKSLLGDKLRSGKGTDPSKITDALKGLLGK